jgi:hypothetical protein
MKMSEKMRKNVIFIISSKIDKNREMIDQIQKNRIFQKKNGAKQAISKSRKCCTKGGSNKGLFNNVHIPSF